MNRTVVSNHCLRAGATERIWQSLSPDCWGSSDLDSPTLLYEATRAKRLRAGDRTRTGDVQLGKLAFYQLNYARNTSETTDAGAGRKGPLFDASIERDLDVASWRTATKQEHQRKPDDE
jgi:hypothetical protein